MTKNAFIDSLNRRIDALWSMLGTTAEAEKKKRQEKASAERAEAAKRERTREILARIDAIEARRESESASAIETKANDDHLAAF